MYLKGDEGYTRVPITTGLSDGLIIEVKSGLKEGDIVRGTRIINFDKMKK